MQNAKTSKARLILLWLHGASGLRIFWRLQCGDKISLPIAAWFYRLTKALAQLDTGFQQE